MKNYIKSKLIRISQRVIILLCLPSILLINSCQGAKVEQSPQITDNNSLECKEIILFSGNPGVGKSSLCNSIFQQPIFESGVSVGVGMTQEKQEYIYENRKYIDTPGLSDPDLRKQAANEIEKALKENSNYKIVFVATLESGRIKPDDLTSINTVCDAIKVHFEYGIIFNKLTEGVIEVVGKDAENIQGYLRRLNKKPSSTLVIKHHGSMQDQKDLYLPSGSEEREKLINFIARLKANMILVENVDHINEKDYKEQLTEMELQLKEETKLLAEEKIKAEAERKRAEAEKAAKIKAETEAEEARKRAEEAERQRRDYEERLRREEGSRRAAEQQRELEIFNNSDKSVEQETRTEDSDSYEKCTGNHYSKTAWSGGIFGHYRDTMYAHYSKFLTRTTYVRSKTTKNNGSISYSDWQDVGSEEVFISSRQEKYWK